MPDDRVRPVDDGAVILDQTLEHIEVTATAGQRADVKGRIEASEALERSAAKAMLQPTPIRSGRNVISVLGAYERGSETLTHSAVNILEDALRLRLELDRKHESRDSFHASRREAGHDAGASPHRGEHRHRYRRRSVISPRQSRDCAPSRARSLLPDVSC